MVLPPPLDYWPLAERDERRDKGASFATRGAPPPPDGEPSPPDALGLVDT